MPQPTEAEKTAKDKGQPDPPLTPLRRVVRTAMEMFLCADSKHPGELCLTPGMETLLRQHVKAQLVATKAKALPLTILYEPVQ